MSSGHATVRPRFNLSGTVWKQAEKERNWLLHRDKIPVNPTGVTSVHREKAATLTHEEALDALARVGEAGGYGIGYLPRPGSAMVAVDIDDAFDADGLFLRPEIAALVEDAGTYVEISPSGTGLRGLIARSDGDEKVNGAEHGGVGLFADGKKFCTVTGHNYNGVCEVKEAATFKDRVLRYREEHGAAKGKAETGADVDTSAQRHQESNRSTWRGIPTRNRAAALTEALQRVPAPETDDEWVRISAAIHSASDTLGEHVAQDIWQNWCDEIGGDQSQNEKRWGSFDSSQQGGVTVATVFSEAEKNGWRSAPHVFSAIGPGDLEALGISPNASGPASGNIFFPASDLHGQAVPARQWLVPDMIPRGTVTLLGGDGGTGKSLLALQLAVAVVLGQNWLERSAASGNAVYLSAEDDRAELHRRLDKITHAAGSSLSALDKLSLCSLAGKDALLATGPDKMGRLNTSPLFRAVQRAALREKPSLIVLDTLADLFPGNENDRAQARQFIGMLRGLAMATDSAVLLLAHPSQHGLSTGAGTSGSTAWNGSVRSRLYLARDTRDGYEPDPDARMLSTKKANYGPVGGEIRIRWDDGVFVPMHSTGGSASAPDAEAERVFLKLLNDYQARGQHVNAKGGSNYAPSTFANDSDAENVPKQAFRRAMQSLLKKGRIVEAEHGSPTRSRKHLALASSNETETSDTGAAGENGLSDTTGEIEPRALSSE
ncbi:RecA-family ATPase [Roseivivax halotolerans]|uniref:RecA-family ATPase n=1 Tax=Roseivivax halotolerans TaxID=93684 RepID=A0A1I5XG69_9RHOB|nr:AAA family ATPase [Roseivivax halotolerans]SFQ30955.1 RecA-family ATPase [Roseivivax halotolerans]